MRMLKILQAYCSINRDRVDFISPNNLNFEMEENWALHTFLLGSAYKKNEFLLHEETGAKNEQKRINSSFSKSKSRKEISSRLPSFFKLG